MKHANNFKDLTGQKFNRLFVLKFNCLNKHQKSMWLCKCDCGAIIIVTGCHLKNGHTKSCGCIKIGKKHTVETKRKMSKAQSGEKHSMYGRRGKNSPNYNPNITDEERQIRRKYYEYKEWREAVYERDNYTCQVCGNRGGNLVAHHLESYHDNPKLRTKLSNGATTCETCHGFFHKQYGYGNNTKEQFEEFKGGIK